METTGPPRFLRDPMPACPALRPRWDLHARPFIRRVGAAFRPGECIGSHDKSLFRGSITRPTDSLSTLRSTGLPATTQDSLPAGGQPLPGGIGLPAGPRRKVSVVVQPLHPSPFPRLNLAHHRRATRPDAASLACLVPSLRCASRGARLLPSGRLLAPRPGLGQTRGQVARARTSPQFRPPASTPRPCVIRFVAPNRSSYLPADSPQFSIRMQL